MISITNPTPRRSSGSRTSPRLSRKVSFRRLTRKLSARLTWPMRRRTVRATKYLSVYNSPYGGMDFDTVEAFIARRPQTSSRSSICAPSVVSYRNRDDWTAVSTARRLSVRQRRRYALHVPSPRDSMVSGVTTGAASSSDGSGAEAGSRTSFEVLLNRTFDPIAHQKTVERIAKPFKPVCSDAVSGAENGGVEALDFALPYIAVQGSLAPCHPREKALPQPPAQRRFPVSQVSETPAMHANHILPSVLKPGPKVARKAAPYTHNSLPYQPYRAPFNPYREEAESRTTAASSPETEASAGASSRTSTASALAEIPIALGSPRLSPKSAMLTAWQQKPSSPEIIITPPVAVPARHPTALRPGAGGRASRTPTPPPVPVQTIKRKPVNVSVPKPAQQARAGASAPKAAATSPEPTAQQKTDSGLVTRSITNAAQSVPQKIVMVDGYPVFVAATAAQPTRASYVAYSPAAAQTGKLAGKSNEKQPRRTAVASSLPVIAENRVSNAQSDSTAQKPLVYNVEALRALEGNPERKQLTSLLTYMITDCEMLPGEEGEKYRKIREERKEKSKQCLSKVKCFFAPV
ncbi:hypothetical protein M8818_001478 [Zalaria obscura]|uniref:Uncharacterized protein n=1 Tax=Zalaria obscura TaxID=2024903 RepID=A0ACC3SKK2_9PEZI